MNLFLFLNLPIIIPRGVAEGEVHEELCQLFDELIPHGVEHGVMIAERIEGDADHDERELRPGEADLPKDSFPRRIADEEIQAEDGHDADADMNRRVKGHFRRAGNDGLADRGISLHHEDAPPRELAESEDEEDHRRRQPHAVCGRTLRVMSEMDAQQRAAEQHDDLRVFQRTVFKARPVRQHPGEGIDEEKIEN